MAFFVFKVFATLFLILAATVRSHSLQRNPLTYLSTLEEPVLQSPQHRVNALSSFDVEFTLHEGQQRVKLSLAPNHDAIAEGATVQYLASDGSVRSSELIDRTAHRVFKGKAWLQDPITLQWSNVGWARITVTRDGPKPIFEGAFRVYGDYHHIQTRTHYTQTRLSDDPWLDHSAEEYMVVWRDSDIGLDSHDELKRSTQEPLCLADELSFNSQPDHPVYRAMSKRNDGFWASISTRSLFGRQIDGGTQTGGNSAGVNLSSTIGSTTGCPSTRKVALVGIATDCTYTASFNSTEAARQNIINQINSASEQYESSFNITLGIQNLTVSDAECPATALSSAPWNVGCSDSVTIQDRLNLFSAWRGERNDNNAYWSLLSTCNTGSAVGLAWLGMACVNTASVATSSSGNETTSGANVIVRTSTEWQVIAHETGHTFGAVHDCTSQTCSDGTVSAQQCCPLSSSTCDAGEAYIMNPSTSSGITKFSACTIGNICSAIGRNSVNTTCLSANRDVTTITGSQCGNGIVESGEDCDCGGEGSCGSNTCCDPTTCKFTTGSVCDPSNDDCCQETCQFSSQGTVCRASTGLCDPEEVCSGSDATCPVDATAPDGQSCDDGLKCASGQCTSRDLQCKSLMGSYTSDNDTRSCSSQGCQISCASPEFGPNVCYSMQQNFLDGTPCQGGGTCSNGNCEGATAGGEIKSWIDDNETLVIGLAATIGGLLLVSLACCLLSCFRRRKRTVVRSAPRPLPAGWGAPPPPVPPMRRERSNRWQEPPPTYYSQVPYSHEPNVRYA